MQSAAILFGALKGLRAFFLYQTNPKNLDLSYKLDLDLWDSFLKGEKPKNYSMKNYGRNIKAPTYLEYVAAW